MKIDLTLYLVTCSDGLSEKDFLTKVEQACRGGVTLVQLREKKKSTREYLHLAKAVKEITDAYGIPLIIDDRADIAVACDAAGVHIGQEDLPVWAARKIVGNDKIVGTSAKTVAQALAAQKGGADYLGVGAIYPTTTKVITTLTPIAVLSDICRAVSIPAIAIGGLNLGNCQALKGVPIAGISVVSAIMKSENPEAAAQKLHAAVSDLLN
ncbi:thiamine phosphate synthase [Caproicibacterium amylolyticum]|uniref:Thiamine-phosphate synthase n=1 Tax=Caproicibacterium amylolyticum TaxID=2766537 RepID=A0A7G9WIM5_9FIRM|nr:thiamine phosphate synthase [Caproicibacterium amylolyticum]QNO18537.1 thiamine phosphate synthase [Caproicibacterium amylolyticum]